MTRRAQPSVEVVSSTVCDVPKPKGSMLDHTAIVSTLRITYLGKTADLVIIECSGRFNAPAEDVAAYHHALVTKYDADLLMTTESEEQGIAEAERKALGTGWGVRKVREYIAAFHKPTVVLDETAPKPHLKRLTRTPGLEDWRNLFIGVFWLRFTPLGLRIKATVGHTPAGIEMGNGFRKGGQHPLYVKTWRDGLKAWGDFLADTVEGVLALGLGDMNANQHTPIWRTRIAKLLRAISIWANKQPKKGSHGSRLIDGIDYVIGAKPAKTTARKATAKAKA